jgi:hypothetical protein
VITVSPACSLFEGDLNIIVFNIYVLYVRHAYALKLEFLLLLLLGSYVVVLLKYNHIQREVIYKRQRHLRLTRCCCWSLYVDRVIEDRFL